MCHHRYQLNPLPRGGGFRCRTHEAITCSLGDANMQKPADMLYSYFSECSEISTDFVGVEVETSFVNTNGTAISVATSQAIFQTLTEVGWNVVERTGTLVTKLQNAKGDILLYELGRQNIELSTAPQRSSSLVSRTQDLLKEIYVSAEVHNAMPCFEPILMTDEDLLVIPDERDATWLEIDGRESLRPLATTSAVQFTFDTTPTKAIGLINQLGRQAEEFLVDYPQDRVWREYIRSSKAGYRSDRYGGPLLFSSLRDYCNKLTMHEVVNGDRLTSAREMKSFSIPLFLRSVWWHFRLRRYGDRLCVEVRPLARNTDERLRVQLDTVLKIMS